MIVRFPVLSTTFCIIVNYVNQPRTATQLLQPTVHLYYTNRTRLNSEEIGDRKMKREVDLNEISDGRLYSSGDMVKVDCHDCEGCSACCQGMGNSILLIQWICGDCNSEKKRILIHCLQTIWN